MEHRTDFRNPPASIFVSAQTFCSRAREMSRERSRAQPGTIEIGLLKPREWNGRDSHDGFACEHPGHTRGFQPGIEIGSSRRIIPSSVRKDLRTRRRLSGTGWLCRPVAARSRTRRAMDRQCPEAAESGWTSDYSREPRQDVWRWLVAGDTVNTECDEHVAQRCGEPARLAPVQKHERERACFCVCTMRFSVCGSAWKMDSGSPENSGSEQFQFF